MPQVVESAAASATKSLQQAIEAGFRDLDRIRNDNDLNPVRARPEFQMLMMDLAFPAEPFAGAER
jgi:hypothetical protein